MLKKIIFSTKRELIYKIFASVFLCALALIIPIYWSKVIDAINLSKYDTAFKMVIIILISSVFYYLWYFFNQKTWFKYYSKIYLKINGMVKKDKITNVDSASYTNILTNDVDTVSTFLANAVTRIIQCVEFIFIFSYFFTINIYIFIITVIVSLSLIVFYIIYGKKIEVENETRKKYLDQKIKTDLENYFNIKEKIKNRITNNKNEIYLHYNSNFQLSSYKSIFIALAILEIIRYSLIFYSIILLTRNKIELGTIILIYTYFGKIITNFETLGTINSELRSFKVSLKRISKII